MENFYENYYGWSEFGLLFLNRNKVIIENINMYSIYYVFLRVYFILCM